MNSMQTDTEPNVAKRISHSLIVESKVRQFMLDHAKKTRHHKFTRVSRATLDKLNGMVRRWIMDHVGRFPSDGTTL